MKAEFLFIINMLCGAFGLLITRRPQVQILAPLPVKSRGIAYLRFPFFFVPDRQRNASTAASTVRPILHDRCGRIVGKVWVNPPDCPTCGKTLDVGLALVEAAVVHGAAPTSERGDIGEAEYLGR